MLRRKGKIVDVTAPEGQKVIVIGPMCWGRGPTVAKAFENAKKEFSSTYVKEGEIRFHPFIVPADAYVTDMGGIEWKKSDLKAVTLEPIVVTHTRSR